MDYGYSMVRKMYFSSYFQYAIIYIIKHIVCICWREVKVLISANNNYKRIAVL